MPAKKKHYVSHNASNIILFRPWKEDLRFIVCDLSTIQSKKMARVSSAVQVIDNILAYAHIDNHDTLDSYAQRIVFGDVE